MKQKLRSIISQLKLRKINADLILRELKLRTDIIRQKVSAIELRNQEITNNFAKFNCRIFELQCLEINANLTKQIGYRSELTDLDLKIRLQLLESQALESSFMRFNSNLRRIKNREKTALDLFALDETQDMIAANGRRNNN